MTVAWAVMAEDGWRQRWCDYCGDPIQPLVYGRQNSTCPDHKDLVALDPFAGRADTGASVLSRITTGRGSSPVVGALPRPEGDESR